MSNEQIATVLSLTTDEVRQAFVAGIRAFVTADRQFRERH